MNDEKKHKEFIEFIEKTFIDVYEVLDHGGKEHGSYMDFLHKKNFSDMNYQHIQGHLREYYNEKDHYDPITGKCDLVHVMCRLLMEMFDRQFGSIQ